MSPGVAIPWPAAPPIPMARSTLRTVHLLSGPISKLRRRSSPSAPYGGNQAPGNLAGAETRLTGRRRAPAVVAPRCPSQSCAEHGAGVKEPGSFAFESQVLVGCRRRHVGDEPDRRLLHAGPERADARLLPDRRVHHLLVDELLDPVEDHLALAAVDLAGELSHQPLDVRIGPVGEGTGRRHEGVEPGRRVPEGSASTLDDGPEPF